MKRRGIAAVQVFALILMFTVTLLWVILAQVYSPHIFPMADTQLANYSQAHNTFTILQTAWNNWPLLIVVGLILFVIVKAQQKEPTAVTGF